MRSSVNTKHLVQLSMLAAIELLVGLVPFLGYIGLPFLPVHITTLQIPVIIAAIILGPKDGGIIGFIFGLTSLINATWLQPNIIESPLFSPFFKGGAFPGSWKSLIICFVPRILVGVVAGYAFILLKRLIKNSVISSIFSSILGALTNTILVLSGIYFFFGSSYAQANKMTVQVLLTTLIGVVATNGLMEAVASAIIVPLVAAPLLILKNKSKL